MAYQALYRQWRPAAFSEMVGQETIVTALRNQVQTGRIAHAYLFCGSRGTGKTSTAKIMARAVNCESPVDGDPCGHCESCRRLLSEDRLDVLEIDAASNNGVDQIRDLRENVKYPPQYGRYKVYIIDEVHMLSASAFNALLKTLEEPPAHVIFILATTEPQRLPATVLSRCQRFDFGRIPAQQIAGRLREAAEGAGAEATDGALMMIARAAEGGMRDALSILDMCLGYGALVDEALVRRVLGTSDRQFLFRFTEALEQEDAASLMAYIDELMRSGREPVVFAREISQHLRALLIAKCAPDQAGALLDLTDEDAGEYAGQAGHFTETRLMSMMELFLQVETALRNVSSPRIALETAALKACLRTGEQDAAALADRISEMEQKLKTLQDRLEAGAFVSAAPSRRPADKTEQKEEQKAAPAPAAGLGGEAVWKAAMDLLRKADAGIHGMLAMGRYLGEEDGTFRWQVKEGSEIIGQLLSGPEKRDRIAEALTSASGKPCRFEVAGPDTKKQENKGDQEVLSALTATFGKERVMIQEDVK